MRIHCIGAGSLGLLWAGKLTAAGLPVKLMTRTEEQSEALNSSGLVVRESGDDCACNPVPVEAISLQRYARESGDDPDWILLTVKQKDIDSGLMDAIKRRCGPNTALCCFQNGIGHLEKLAESVGDNRLYAAVTTEAARRTGLTEVCHTGRGITRIGQAFRRESCVNSGDKINRLANILIEAGFHAEISNFIERDIWNKLLINVVINPLTAILRIPNGALLESEHSLGLMKALFDEAADLAKRLRIETTDDLWERVVSVCRSTAANHSSMLQDLEAGRITEIEWLNGNLIREARRISLELPFHETLYRLVKCKEQLIIPPGDNREV